MRAGRSGNQNLMSLSPDLAGLNIDRVKPMTLRLLLPSLVLGIRSIRIEQGWVGSVSG